MEEKSKRKKKDKGRSEGEGEDQDDWGKKGVKEKRKKRQRLGEGHARPQVEAGGAVGWCGPVGLGWEGVFNSYSRLTLNWIQATYNQLKHG